MTLVFAAALLAALHSRRARDVWRERALTAVQLLTEFSDRAFEDTSFDWNDRARAFLAPDVAAPTEGSTS